MSSKINTIRRVAARFAASVKHPDVVRGLVDYLKDGDFKAYLKIKSARGGKIVIKPTGLNEQVARVEIKDLAGDKAQFVIHLKNGDSGWDWNEHRLPPKFHNNPGYNVIHLDKLERIANPNTDPHKFANHMMSLCKGTLVPAIQKAGWVVDRSMGPPMPFDEWQEANAKQNKEKAEAEKLREKLRKDQEAAEVKRQKLKAENPDIDSVRSVLRSLKYGPAGRPRSVEVDGPGQWTIEPMNRQRLDHYVGEGWGDRRDEDDDPEGWDSDAWEDDYSGPVYEAARKGLAAEFGPGLFEIEVGDKGHIFVTLTNAGAAKFKIKM